MQRTEEISTFNSAFISGTGEMADLTRAFDWSKTALGTPDKWPQSLLTTLGIILHSRFPMFLWWGEDLIQFYNDAYRPSLGIDAKHPAALGCRGEDCWQEIWPVIKPLINQVLSGGESTWSENQLIPIFRNGRIEDVYWTFSYSRVNNDNGEPAGVLVICTETTGQVVAFQNIEKTKNELEFAVNAAELATWDLDPKTMKVIGNNRLRQWFGLEAGGEISLDRVLSVIADFDRERALEAIRLAMMPQSGGHYNIEYTIINPLEPQPRTVKAKGKALFNADNEVVRFSGTLQDITEEKRAAEQLIVNNLKLERAYEQSRLSKTAAHLGTFDMDLEKGTLEWDERCRTLFGISHQNTVTFDHDFVVGLHPDDRERVLRKIDNVFIKSVSNGDYDIEYRTIGQEDQQLRWVRAIGKAFFDEEDKPQRFIGSVLDITEKKSDELRKNDFIGMVSHELKTPLTSINVYIQMLLKKADEFEDNFFSTALAKVNLQIRRMTGMINGFLNMSRLESGKIYLEPSQFQIEDLINSIIEEVLVAQNSHTIVYDDKESITVVADYNKLSAVISNLLSNAIKYSPRGKTIEITCRRSNDQVLFSIRDEGMGIKSEDIDKLFDRFYRIQTKHTQNISGFGIGLYLSSEIIQHHNGKIWVESTSGVGSTFYFTLPYHPIP